MRVAVLVPWRGGCLHRERVWQYIQRLYAERHPGWQVIEAPAPEGPWSKGAALSLALTGCDAEIIVQADADVWTNGLSAAVEAVKAGASWAIPHRDVLRLSEEGTEVVLAGGGWEGQPLDQKPYKGLEGGGFVVAPREVIHSIPTDSRFTGWG